jgi:signal transduction histidine kinase
MIDWQGDGHQFGASFVSPIQTMHNLPDALLDETLSCVLRVNQSGLRSLKSNDPVDLFDSMAEALACLTHADFAGVHILESDRDLLRLAAHRGFTPLIAGLYDAGGEGHALCRSALEQRNGLAVESVRTSPGLWEATRRTMLDGGVSAFLIVPLVSAGGDALGVLTASFRTARAFDQDETGRVELLASHATSFVETIRLHQTLARRLADARDAHERVDAMNRRKDQFIATVSHELRQPLAAALPALEVQKRSLSPERRHRAGEVIEQQLRHIARLVEDLTDVSHISRGTLELRVERVDLRVVIKQAIDMTAATFGDQRQQITFTLGDSPAWMSGDAARLKQVFSNLLRNAAAYTPSGGHIEVYLERADDELIVRVRDSGVGIPPGALSRIFMIFERGDGQATGNGASQGFGIGLALVRQIVELHGGTVSATSDGDGQGSEFVVRLPPDDQS